MEIDYQNDLSIRAKIAETMEVSIDDWFEANNQPRHSRRLGSSSIGKACSRELWYAFRWAKKPTFGSPNRPAGRVFRLFSRGHREEPEIIKWLEAIGCTFETPPEGEEQFTFSLIEDHAVTKVDGIGRLPRQFGVSERVLFEFKTANLTYFTKFRKEGIKAAEPKYWSQSCFSAKAAGLEYVLYVVSCKNDDDILIEFHRIDQDYAEQMVDKAGHVITSQTAPHKISQSNTNFACKFCDFKDICHSDEKVERNCRSCEYASPGAAGAWVCTNPAYLQAGETCVQIPEHVILNGCDQHRGIK